MSENAKKIEVSDQELKNGIIQRSGKSQAIRLKNIVEIKLTYEDDKPVKNEPFRILNKNNDVIAEGNLDSNGNAKVEVAYTSYKIDFPKRGKDDWEEISRNNFKLKQKNFVILIGGPGIYDGKDTEHDKAWYNYVNPVMLATKAGKLAQDNEKVYWVVYSPAYEARWNVDKEKPSWGEKHVYDSDLSITRFDHTRKVINYGASDYMDYIKRKAEDYSKNRSYTIEVVFIDSAKQFWGFLEKLPDKNISRVWYVGHASGDLWLNLYHSADHVAQMRGDKKDKEAIKADDIETSRNLKNKFSESKLSSKFYGCNTNEFAEKWSKVFEVKAEGAEGKINFQNDDLTKLENSATKKWMKFGL